MVDTETPAEHRVNLKTMQQLENVAVKLAAVEVMKAVVYTQGQI